MPLLKSGAIVTDNFVDVSADSSIPDSGSIIVSLEQWLANLDALIARREPIGIRLRSDQHPEVIADDLDHFSVIALEFPIFKDGRAYSYARLLRERWGYAAELRAVGDVLLEQLHFMQRVGFDAFELKSADPVSDWLTASGEFSAWYQATGDGRVPARALRHQT
ncbi:MAG: DUF934 domain-containing protein [Gammaproteobacteria bacterium]|nr:DUF934 domain-containing protein [Gammaproteobacteria bacterium]